MATPLESNFLVPDATFFIALLVFLAVVSALILVGVLVTLRTMGKRRADRG